MSAYRTLAVIRTARGYALSAIVRYRQAVATIVKADLIVQAMGAAADTDTARAEWAAYLYSRYCGNGSVPMPSSVMP